MTALDAAAEVLRRAGMSLHIQDITDRMLELGLWQTNAKTPSNTVSTRLSDDIATNGEESRFRRVRSGVYGLNDRSAHTKTPKPSAPAPGASEATMSFRDAAERVLRQNDGHEPLHYREITRRMFDLKLVSTKSKSPSDTLHASISNDIKNRAIFAKPQRFVRLGKGLFGLADAESGQTRESSVDTDLTPEPKLSYTDAAERVLRENDGQAPLHYREITRRILDLDLVAAKSASPSDALHSGISDEIQRRTNSNKPQRFVRLGKGLFGLADAESGQTRESSVDTDLTPEPKLSYTDAAERVLRENDGREPLHYREIARRMLDLKLVETRAVTPAYTLNAAVGDEIRRRQEASRPQRFVRVGRGLIGLADAEPEGVRKAIEKENRQVRGDLMDFLRSIDPTEFEHLVGELFNAMGAESVEVTRGSVDGGVDVRGTLLVGGAIRIKIAAQAKRWKENVGIRTVKELRGGLLPDETGLIVTTSRFTSTAKETAQAPGLTVITLIDGDALVDLMVEHEIWVSRQQHDLLTLSTPSPDRIK